MYVQRVGPTRRSIQEVRQDYTRRTYTSQPKTLGKPVDACGGGHIFTLTGAAQYLPLLLVPYRDVSDCNRGPSNETNSVINTALSISLDIHLCLTGLIYL